MEPFHGLLFNQVIIVVGFQVVDYIIQVVLIQDLQVQHFLEVILMVNGYNFNQQVTFHSHHIFWKLMQIVHFLVECQHHLF